jgi:hypothetical protein
MSDTLTEEQLFAQQLQIRTTGIQQNRCKWDLSIILSINYRFL